MSDETKLIVMALELGLLAALLAFIAGMLYGAKIASNRCAELIRKSASSSPLAPTQEGA